MIVFKKAQLIFTTLSSIFVLVTFQNCSKVNSIGKESYNTTSRNVATSCRPTQSCHENNGSGVYPCDLQPGEIPICQIQRCDSGYEFVNGVCEQQLAVPCPVGSPTCSDGSMPPESIPTPNPPPGPAPTPTPSVPVVNSEYKALVGYTHPSSFKNFKDIYSPAMLQAREMLQDDSDRPGKKKYVIESTTQDNYADPLSKLKLYMPKGTHRLTVAIFAYYSDSVEQAASFRFGQPPTVSYEQVGFYSPPAFDDQSRVFENLYRGLEWAKRSNLGLNYMPSPTGGGIGGAEQNFFQTPQGGWLYINILQAAGGRVMSFKTRVEVDQSAYESWYRTAVWDTDGNPR